VPVADPAALERTLRAVIDAAALPSRLGGADRLLVTVPDWSRAAGPAVAPVLASTDVDAHEVVVGRWLRWIRDEAKHTGAPSSRVERAHGTADVGAGSAAIEIEWVDGTAGPPGARVFLATGLVPGACSIRHALAPRSGLAPRP
jgi:hypothetical protein